MKKQEEERGKVEGKKKVIMWKQACFPGRRPPLMHLICRHKSPYCRRQRWAVGGGAGRGKTESKCGRWGENVRGDGRNAAQGGNETSPLSCKAKYRLIKNLKSPSRRRPLGQAGGGGGNTKRGGAGVRREQVREI